MRHTTTYSSIVLLFLAMTTMIGASMNDAARREAFADAEQAFRNASKMEKTDPASAKASYQKAALGWKRLVDDGVTNGHLLYNLANAYVKLGDLGRAILNYRRAESLLPNDRNLKKNLELARARQKDKLRTNDTAKIKTVLLFWHYDLSSTVKKWIFVGTFMAFWVMMIIRTISWKSAPVKILIALAIVATAFGASSATDLYLRNVREYGVVIDSTVTARQGDGDGYRPSFKQDLHAGLEFRLLKKRNGWMHVELADERDCWLPVAAVELIRPSMANRSIR